MKIQLLTKDQFARFARLVYDRTGIFLAEGKRTMLSNRLRRRLRALDLPDFDAYYDLMRVPKKSDAELSHFLAAVTTNETYFFRNPRLWAFFAEKWLPEFVKKNARGTKSLNIWSAAASSGEEAYTAAIVLRENLPNFSSWNVTIRGTDISESMLEKARGGLYADYAVSRMEPERVKRWFDHDENGYQLKDKVRKMVRYEFHNLRDSFAKNRFDFILLRNVLMYFDTPMKQRVIDVVSEALAPGGTLFVGDVDPIRTCQDLMKSLPLEVGPPALYLKPGGVAAHAAGSGR